MSVPAFHRPKPLFPHLPHPPKTPVHKSARFFFYPSFQSLTAKPTLRPEPPHPTINAETICFLTNKISQTRRTGPISEAGRAISARNATRHGMCATTLIMDGQVQADWLDLIRTWLDAYQNPADSTLLYTFVLKTAQAEWHRLRVQREYDFHMFGHGSPPIAAWQPHEIKNHDLILRYLMRRKPLQPAGTETMRRKPLQPAGTETMKAHPITCEKPDGGS